MISDIEKTLSLFLDQRNIADTSVLVAFSGGVDSSVLLSALNAVKTQNRIKLIACHINHSLRAEESDQDAAFCFDFCKNRGISFFNYKADVSEYSRNKKVSLELAGREIRKAFLNEKAKEMGCRYIFLAHHQDDQIETLLFRFFRGSGLYGMQGIQPFLLKDSVYWCRPLLEISKDAILEYARTEQIQWRTDSSNNSLEYSRNKIRNELIPVIKKYFDSFPDSLLRFQRLSQGLTHEFYSLLSQSYHDLFFCKPGHVFIMTDQLKHTAPHLFAELLRKFLKESQLSHYLPDYEFCMRLHGLSWKKTGNKLELSSGLKALKDRGWIHVYSSDSGEKIPLRIKTEIRDDFETCLPYKEAEMRLYKDLVLNKMIVFSYALKTEWKDFEMEIRTPDLMNLNQLELAGKNLKNLFSEKKVPYALMDSIPLVFLNNELILIPGIAGDPRYITSRGRGVKVTYNFL